MKKISFVFVLVFAKVAMAQSLSVGLDMNGTFSNGQSKVVSSQRKACVAHQGRYLGKGRCKVQKAGTASIRIQKSEMSDAFNIEIQNTNSTGVMVKLPELVAANINVVQLISPVTDQCRLTVGFTSPTTLSTWVDGDCSDEDKAALTIGTLTRTSK